MSTIVPGIDLTPSPRVHLILETGLAPLALDARRRAILDDVTLELVSTEGGGYDIFLAADQTPVCGLHLRAMTL